VLRVDERPRHSHEEHNEHKDVPTAIRGHWFCTVVNVIYRGARPQARGRVVWTEKGAERARSGPEAGVPGRCLGVCSDRPSRPNRRVRPMIVPPAASRSLETDERRAPSPRLDALSTPSWYFAPSRINDSHQDSKLHPTRDQKSTGFFDGPYSARTRSARGSQLWSECNPAGSNAYEGRPRTG